MKKKLIITHSSELSPRWVNYYCLDTLSREFDFEYWDFSACTYPNFKSPVLVDKDYVVKINNLKDLKKNIKRLPKDTIVLNDIFYNHLNYKVHKIISSKFSNNIYINFFSGNNFKTDNFEDVNTIPQIQQNIPEQRGHTKLLKRLYGKFYRFIAKNEKLFMHLLYIKNLGGNVYKQYRNNYYDRKCRELYHTWTISCEYGAQFKINNPDIDRFLTIKNSQPIISRPYIVYIDNNYPFHTENKLYQSNFDPNVEARKFYPSLNNFFAIVENTSNCDIIIAGHPTANYDKNPFGGREIINGKTAELIKHAQAVLLHNSLAVSFVCLYDKPFLLISNNSFMSSSLQKKNIEAYARGFNVSIFDIDNMLFDSHSFIHLTPSIRECYLKKYLGFQDADGNNEKLIPKHLRNLYVQFYHDNNF